MLYLLLGLLGCSGQDADTATGDPPLDAPRGDCNPVEDSHCMLPWPSEFFLEPDTSRASGYAVDLGPTTLPANIDDVQIRPDYWNAKDGFPTLGMVYAHLQGATLDGTPGLDDIGAYLDDDIATVIINATTGERLPHFVEREDSAPDPDQRLMILRPATAMDHATRYVVGIRGLRDEAGELVPAPEGFATLRDGSATDDPDIERQRDHYDAIVFPTLEAQGFQRDELQLAWSFVTVSAQDTTERMLWMRDDALERMGDAGPDYVITDVQDTDCASGARIGRQVQGTLSAPLYLTDWSPGTDSVLARDPDGAPMYNGQADAVPFTIRVPCTLLDDPRPAPLLQYGHGLLGSQDELSSGFLDTLAQDNGWIVFAVDWTGMKNMDAAYISMMMVDDPSNFAMVPERTMQGYVEAMAAARMMRGAMVDDPNLVVDGTPLIDPSTLWFYGNSQGAVLGGGLTAISPDIQRAVLGVPGTPFTLLLTRAVGFEAFLTLLQTMYEDWVDISLLIGSFQMLWDEGETAGYVHFVTDQPLDDLTPNKDVLMQAAIGDASVPTVGAHVMARSFGASLIAPATREVWGLEERTPPFQGSALVEFDYGYPDSSNATPADADHNTHGRPRGSTPGMAQISAFFNDGLVTHTCDGTCDPD